jgi:hypothetical protein
VKLTDFFSLTAFSSIKSHASLPVLSMLLCMGGF